MAPPINVQDWYGDRHTCQIASGALESSLSAKSSRSSMCGRPHICVLYANWPPYLPRQQWSLLNRFNLHGTGTLRCLQKELATYRHWSVSLWRDETQTMAHIVESCPLTKLNGSLSRLHSAEEVAASWKTSYGSWHAYEKKKIGRHVDLRHCARAAGAPDKSLKRLDRKTPYFLVVRN